MCLSVVLVKVTRGEKSENRGGRGKRGRKRREKGIIGGKQENLWEKRGFKNIKERHRFGRCGRIRGAPKCIGGAPIQSGFVPHPFQNPGHGPACAHIDCINQLSKQKLPIRKIEDPNKCVHIDYLKKLLQHTNTACQNDEGKKYISIDDTLSYQLNE